MKNIKLFLAAAVATGLFLGCSGNKTKSGSDTLSIATDSNRSILPSPDSSSAILADTTFAAKAAIGGMAEVELGKMAAEKGSNSKVKNFGKMMVTDHSKANLELKNIAKEKKMSLPTALDAEHQAKSDSLGKLSGKDFDIGYTNVMVEGHKKTLALMESEAKNGQDAKLKAFAGKTATVVQMHLTEIMKIKNALK